MKGGERAPRIRRANAGTAVASGNALHTVTRRRRAERSELGKRLAPDDRRAQILRVAEELFTQRPFGELGIAEVARAAGITHGLVYHYFGTKEKLFGAAVEASAAELLRACLPDRTLPVPRQFELGIQGYLDHVEGHRVAYLNLFRGPASVEPVFIAIADRTRHALMDYMIETLELTGCKIPATRISLHGTVGYVENVILDWLEHPGVARTTLERVIFAVILVALRMGLEHDRDVPLSGARLRDFERSYKKHFNLP